NIHAKLDMGEISKLLDIDSSGIKGEIIVDIMLDEFIDPDSLDALSAKLQKGSESKIVFRDFSLETDLFPSKLEQINGAVHLEKGHLVMDSLSVRIDSSDLLLYGKITNFLPFLHWEPDDLIIRLEGKSSKLDLEKLMATQSNASPFSDVLSDLSFGIHFETHTYALWESSFLPEGEFFIDSLFCKLRDFPHELHDFSADILIDSQSVTIKDFHGEVDDSDFNLTAHLQGIEWLNRKDTVAPLLMAIELKSNHLHFQDLMTYKGVQYLPEDYRGEYLSELNIRAEMQTDNQALNSTKMLPDLSLKLEDAHFYLQHHQRKFQNIRASLLFRDGNLEIENVSGNLGASDLMVKGKIQGINDQVSTPKYTIELAAQYLDIDELLDYEINKTNQLHDSAFNVFEKPFANLSLEANVEELVYHKFHFKQLHTRLRTTPDHYIYLDTLHTNGADGSLALNGYFNGSNPSRIYFKSTLQLRDMNIDKIFYKFENFGQDHLLSENLHGYITADVNSRVRMYPDLTPIIEESEAHAEVRINEGSILNYAPLKAMSDYFTDKNLDSVRFGELINTFDLKDGTLYIPNMTISSTLGFLDVSGQQSAKEDLSMDYLLRIPLKMVKKATFNKLFNRQGNNDQEEEIMEDSGKGLRVNVRVTGTPERYDVKMGKRK
ncbi:MAG TPA: AsmA-like C-terminal region-containing protein, partial [Saprospiraceae bacterium]|nr:AsmA-like C-terminal region-containing protein [Saprospiraceae bacterium]